MECRHILCQTCYLIIHLRAHLGRAQYKPQLAVDVYCCRCGEPTSTPVPYRHEHGRFPCNGNHPYVPLWISGVSSRYDPPGGDEAA